MRSSTKEPERTFQDPARPGAGARMDGEAGLPDGDSLEAGGGRASHLASPVLLEDTDPGKYARAGGSGESGAGFTHLGTRPRPRSFETGSPGSWRCALASGWRGEPLEQMDLCSTTAPW